MQRHFRLEHVHHGLQLSRHEFRGEHLIDLAQPGEELVEHLLIFQQLSNERVVDFLVTGAGLLEIAGGAVEAAVKQAVVGVVENPLPLLPFPVQLVEADIAGVRVAKEHFKGHIVEVVVHVDVVKDVLKVLFIGSGRGGLHLINHLAVFLVATIVDRALGLQQVHIIRFLQ